ncbi:MAG: hypothetical protein HRU28_12670 [Rhizobiales bacterium]|nr:hypothetical protein [Hyphomicrobiales bacterium]
MIRFSLKSEIAQQATSKIKSLKSFYLNLQKTRASGALHRDFYPTFVTFDDVLNPKSVKQVDPDNLFLTFGTGYNVKSITIEIVDENMSVGKLESLLPWINNKPNAQLDDNSALNSAAEFKYANSLNVAEFIRKQV